MKAIRYYEYGSPEVLRFEDSAVPPVGDEDVLVRVRAAAVNPLDLHFMRGTPYFMRAETGPLRPKRTGLGSDLAGSVVEVGKDVTKFAPGDEVFGSLSPLGTFAEYVILHSGAALLAKPAGLTFEQAASVPLAGCTALQAVRDKGRVQAGQRVLVNGAAGGVGTFAVQIAKALGAEVTGVCSTTGIPLVASIGADHVIDYTQQDFTRTGQRYDVMIDIAGNRTLVDCRRVLTPKGVLAGLGAPDSGRWLGPMIRPLRMLLLSPLVSQAMTFFISRQSSDDLSVLAELSEAGKVKPVIDRTFPLSEAPQALRYLEKGHARGKVVITM